MIRTKVVKEGAQHSQAVVTFDDLACRRCKTLGPADELLPCAEAEAELGVLRLLQALSKCTSRGSSRVLKGQLLQTHSSKF